MCIISLCILLSFYLSSCQDEEMERLRKRGERFGTSVSPAIAKERQTLEHSSTILLSSLC